MSHRSDERLRRVLRDAVPPADVSGPSRDLWPQVSRRLAEAPARASRLDWALLAALLAWLVFFPENVMALLYHL
jgi:hypothetical protein